MVFTDVMMMLFALWLSFSLRLGQFHIPEQAEVWVFFITPFIAIPLFVKFGLYRAIVRYIGFKAL
jgi:UDP-N-acetylglucosamine 4,6-dehydratase